MTSMTALRHQDIERASHRSATLGQTLQVFRALLRDDEPAAVSSADALVWAYLHPVPGLRSQIEALDVLWLETAALCNGSAFWPRLLDTLDRHRGRLGTVEHLKLSAVVVVPGDASAMAGPPKLSSTALRPSASRDLPAVGSFHG